MFYTIRCNQGTATDTIRAGVARAPADKVVLTFPLGVACAVSNAAELEALWAHCQALGKTVVVIGGDQALRAHAVAAGFTTATALEEWEPPSREAAHRRRLTLGPILGKRATADPQATDVRVVRETVAIAEEGASDLYDSVGEDPPGYVADLVAADESLSPAALQSDAPTLPLQRSRITRRLQESRREAAAAAALDRAHQDYEDRITEQIRVTGAASAAETTAAPTTGANPAEAGAETADEPMNGGTRTAG